MLGKIHVSLLFAGVLCIGWCGTGLQAAQQPEVCAADSLPGQWRFEPATDGRLGPSDGGMWWKRFGDATLDSLIALGLEKNYDVLTAARRMEIARQTLNEVRSQYFPSFTLNGGWSKGRTSGAMTTSPTAASTSSRFSLGVDMSWQIDIFGKITSQARENAARLQVSRAEYAGAMLTLCGDIASSYVQLRVLQAEQQVAAEHLERQLSVLRIAQARHEAGLASELDVLQASTVYNSTRATIPGLMTAITTTVNAIEVLLGEMPGQGAAALLAPAPMPDYRALIAAQVPMELLRRRPDIVSAEATLAAYAAAAGIAKKDFLPTLSLNGSISTSARRLDNLFRNNALEYSIAPTLSWTVFEGMRRSYALAAAREQMLIGIDSYNLTLITAVKEADNAMATYVNTCREVEITAEVVDQARRSVELSVELYRSGLSGFTEVADAQLNYLTYSDALIRARGEALTALVTLCEAMGGGWADN